MIDLSKVPCLSGVTPLLMYSVKFYNFNIQARITERFTVYMNLW